MSKQSIESPFGKLYQALRAVPATLNGTTTIATNNVLVTASRNDPWIRAASTNTTGAFVPAFVRAAAVVSFDFYLCGGNGSIIPGAEVEIVVPTAMADAAATISNTGTGAVLEADVAFANIAANTRVGRFIRAKADSVGRVTGTLTLSDSTDRLILVNFLHIRTSLTTTVIAT